MPEHLQEKNQLPSAHLREKKGLYYIVLNTYKMVDGKKVRNPKWIPTGLQAVKGNKRQANRMMIDAQLEYSNKTSCEEALKEQQADPGDILFADFIEKQWLPAVKAKIRKTTYSAYSSAVNKYVAPYFRELGIKLKDLRAEHIQAFYAKQAERQIKNNTIIKYHAAIYSSVKYALKHEKITYNPMLLVERPKPEPFIGKFYSSDEVQKLLAASKGTKLELAILFGAFYGMRRSEIVGLQWESFDFFENHFTIQHTATTTYINDHCVTVDEDQTKSRSSMRTLPLVAPVKQLLLDKKKEQDEYKRLCGRSYNDEYLEYIYVDEIGERIKPGYITNQFPIFLARNGFRKIRFHDLRHTCASLMVMNGVSLKEIQEWLGHSDITTTSKYAHLDMKRKKESADKMMGVVKLNQSDTTTDINEKNKGFKTATQPQ